MLYYCTKNRLYSDSMDFRFDGPMPLEDVASLASLQENDIVSNAGQLLRLRNGQFRLNTDSNGIDAPKHNRYYHVNFESPGIYSVVTIDEFDRWVEHFRFHCIEMISLPIILRAIECGLNLYLNDYVTLHVGDDFETYRMSWTRLVKD